MMKWNVRLTPKVNKSLKKLSNRVVLKSRLLIRELEATGPSQPAWPNYGKLLGTSQNVDKRHCHLVKRRPTYVICWEVTSKFAQEIEVYYVGTHEGAPY